MPLVHLLAMCQYRNIKQTIQSIVIIPKRNCITNRAVINNDELNWKKCKRMTGIVIVLVGKWFKPISEGNDFIVQLFCYYSSLTFLCLIDKKQR